VNGSTIGLHQARRGVGAALVVGVIVVVAIVASSGGGGHRLWVTLSDATGVLPGQQLRMAGQPIGQISSVEVIGGGHGAKLGLTLDDTAWPLTQGTTMRLRWGGTISFLERYIAVTRGPGDRPAYPDNGTFPASAFTVPIEFDTLVDDFTPKVRRDIHALLTRGGASLAAAQPALKQTLQRTPAALTQADQLLTAIDSTGLRLATLVSSTGRVVEAVHAADPTVEQAVTGAGETFAAVGSSTRALQSTLAQATGTFVNIRGTLATADRTLDLAGEVTTRLTPGVTQLRETLAPLDQLLNTVVAVGPTARATLSTAARSAPQVTTLLTRATQLMPQIDSVLTQAVPQLACVRPYTPDLMSFFTNWGGFLSETAGGDYYARVVPAAVAWAPTTVQAETPAQAAQIFPSLTDAFPRPPGYMADQSWFQPQCGAGPDAINPSKDPETRPGQTYSLPSLIPVFSSGGQP
jgi:ABC-type transporter Mla subunit MlaD